MFREIDTSDDHRVSIEEFKKSIPIMSKWGIKITDPESEFNKIVPKGAKNILFEEFSYFCIMQNLNLENYQNDV